MKVVFDTNVLVSAFVTDGLCSKLLKRANRGAFKIYISPFIFQEFQRSLKIKFLLSQTEIKEAVSLLKEVTNIVNPEEEGAQVTGVCRDKDDDFVISCALASSAHYIVTGDKDLLTIKEYKGIKIISPRDFELFFD